MLKKFINLVSGDPNKKVIDSYSRHVIAINSLEPEYEKLSNEALRNKTDEFKQRLHEGESLNDLLVEAFATVREASKRTIGLRHYDVQLIGGIVLHQGKIAEMRTGEGKTLVATLPLYLNALTGKGSHLITVNDYLARRDARWMAPIYTTLGLSVGVLQIAARTENGKKAFLVDLEKESPHEDQNQLVMVPRREAYLTDILYGTNSEFGFDYLRDNMSLNIDDRVQRGHFYAIVDEVDNVLIDEARTPLIISGPAEDESQWYLQMSQVVRQLRPDDVDVDEKNHLVVLSEIGELHVEEILGTPLRDPDRPEDLTPEQARILGYLEQALRAQYLFRRNKDYLVQSGKVVIVDEFTGRLMPGRRWSEGLHQAVEAKEGVKVEPESVTYATITIQNYFRMYEKLAGMTGTAVTEAEEFDKIYKLDVVAIPMNLEYQASVAGSDLVELETRDESGYKFGYYAVSDDPQKLPVFWRRKDFPDIVYRTEEMKLRAICQEILHYHVLGRPVLVGTTSVELSERLSSRLRAEPLRRLVQVMLFRKTWLEKNDREEDGRQIPELQFMYEPIDRINISQMRQLTRDLGISFNPEDPENIQQIEYLLHLSKHDRSRLIADLQGGIPHQVLNARKHTEESQIIAEAGAFGAVTIATNMAGRGVDIKLGGELAEEILAAVNRVLRRNETDDPYEMTMEERFELLKSMDPADYGIYEAEINFFFQHMKDMEQVRDLGGLHVIGSERHEARRIDNQLRGRAARQGDPGSSRFYLSMEDELMRMFGGQQADGLMKRLKIDDAVPLEANLVGRLVESSQNRVEGANFDVRKHLLEYDDVLNNQRTRIYNQRDLIFQKDDLFADVREMLHTELSRRIPEAFNSSEGPWQLLAWMNDIQPSFPTSSGIYPTFTLKLLADEILGNGNSGAGNQKQTSREQVFNGLVHVVDESLNAEEDHLTNALEELLEQSLERQQSQLAERSEAVEMFFEGLEIEDEESGQRKPQELISDLQVAAGIQLRLTPAQQRQLVQNPREIQDEIDSLVDGTVISQTITRLIGAVERRLEEPLNISADALITSDWENIENTILSAVEDVFEKRHERFIGNGTPGVIVREIESALDKIEEPVSEQAILNILYQLPLGSRSTFDRKTHRRVKVQTNRLTYFYYSARLISDQDVEDITEIIQEHFENALEELKITWGKSEFNRLQNLTIADLDENARNGLSDVFGEEYIGNISSTPLNSLGSSDIEKVQKEFGRRALTEIYRQLILSVISNLWIDYLTEMEALRVSINLEAYAQRDPLVQYKNRAYENFQQLLNNVRLGVISRMFNYRPRNLTDIQIGVDREEIEAGITDVDIIDVSEEELLEIEAAEDEAEPAAQVSGPAPSSKKDQSKKRRRRRR